MDRMNRHSKTIFAAGLICFLGSLIYANAIRGSFQFDDYPVIVHNPVIRADNMHTLWQTVPHPTRFIAYVSFALNYAWNGLDPAGYHIVNILIHLANALLVFQLVRLLFRTPVMRRDHPGGDGFHAAAVAALLFVCHPLQTESVTYITQRFTSLAVLFYLASLCLYLTARFNDSNRGRMVLLFGLSGVCAVAGMLTKQITLTLPLMVVLIEILLFEPKTKKAWGRLFFPLAVLLLLVPAFYSFDVFNILSITHESGSHQGDVITSATYALTQPRVIMTYLKLLIVPVQQNLLYDFPVSRSLFEWKTFLSSLAIILILWAGGRLYRVNRLYTFGIFWFFIALMVESTFIPIRHVIFEHRTYLPSVGFFLAAALLLNQMLQEKRIYYAVVVGVVVVLSVMTVRRNVVWQNGVAMWEDVVRKSPGQARPYYNLGYEHLKNHEPQSALQNFSKALSIDPEYFDAYNNRSQVYVDLGRLDKAMEDINQAIRINDRRAEAFLNRGMIVRRMGQHEIALEDFNRAIELDPQNPVYYMNRGLTYGNTGQHTLALNDLNQALKMGPRFAKAYNVRGAVYMAMSRPDEALDDFTQAVRHDPSDLDARRNRAQLFQDRGKFDDAITDLNAIIKNDPADLDAYLRRAFLLTKMNRLDDALKDFSFVAGKGPAMASIYFEKGKIYFRLQRYKEAAAEFDQALKRSPNDASGYLLRGLCHYELKQYRQALQDVSRARDLGQPVDEHYFIRIQQAMGHSS